MDRRPINRATSSESNAQPLRTSGEKTEQLAGHLQVAGSTYRPGNEPERTACSCQDWGLLEAGPFLPQGATSGP